MASGRGGSFLGCIVFYASSVISLGSFLMMQSQPRELIQVINKCILVHVKCEIVLLYTD